MSGNMVNSKTLKSEMFQNPQIFILDMKQVENYTL